MFFTNAGPANRLEFTVRSRIDHAIALRQRGDRGASAIEWVIISAVLILIVGVVGTAIYNKLQTAANQLDVNPKVGGGNG